MESKVEALLLQEGIVVELADTPAALREAQALRYRVFCLERGIFAAAPGQEIDADEFDLRSTHVVLRRWRCREVVATARVVAGSADPGAVCLPMQRYCCPTMFGYLAMDTIGEISRMAISKQFRHSASGSGALLRLGLLRGILQASEENGLTHWCALMAPSLLRLLRATGVHFAHLGNLVEAYGLRQPCMARIDLTLALGKRTRPDFYGLLNGQTFAHRHRVGPRQTGLSASPVA